MSNPSSNFMISTHKPNQPHVFGNQAPIVLKKTIPASSDTSSLLFSNNNIPGTTGFSNGGGTTFKSFPPLLRPPSLTATSQGVGIGTGVDNVSTSNASGCINSVGVTHADNPRTLLSNVSAGENVVTSLQLSTGGLSGIPGTAISSGVSTLAFGGSYNQWTTIDNNRALHEMIVPPEIVAVFEEFKAHVSNQKAEIALISRMMDVVVDIDAVAEQIEDAEIKTRKLETMMYKKELQSVSFIKDMQVLTKDLDVLRQIREMPITNGPSTMAYFIEMADRYWKRLSSYKAEFEKAEDALRHLSEPNRPSPNDLWTALTSTKDAVILLSSRLQQLLDNVRDIIKSHKNISQEVYGCNPKPWLETALSRSLNLKSNDNPQTPLQKLYSTPTERPQGSPNIKMDMEVLLHQFTSMMGHDNYSHGGTEPFSPSSKPESFFGTPYSYGQKQGTQ